MTLTLPEYWEKEDDRDATIIVKTEGIERAVGISQTHPVFKGIWILSESGSVRGGADLAYYDVADGEMRTQYYSEVNNGESLGTVANFAAVYGGKMYVAVSGSANADDSSVKVIDPKTGQLISTINIQGQVGGSENARQLAFHGGKVYVTSYFGGASDEDPFRGGVTRIDTLSLTIEAATPVGYRPEGITYHNGKLIVCNNGTMDYAENGDQTIGAGVGTTMSIVDVATFQEERVIDVPRNPVYIQTTTNGEIYFSTPQVYPTGFTPGVESAPSALHKLDPETWEVTTFEDVRTGFGRFAATDKYIYTGEFSYSTYMDDVFRIDRETGESEQMEVDLGDNVFMLMLYGVGINPLTGDIYLGGMGEDVVFVNEGGEYMNDFQIVAPFITTFIPMFE